MIEQVNNSSLIDFFRSEVYDRKGTTAAAYRKALSSLSAFAGTYPEGIALHSTTFLCDWIVWMNREGLTLNTAAHYLNVVAALFTTAVAAGKVQKTGSFRIVKSAVRELGPEAWSGGLTEAGFARFLNFVRKSTRAAAETQMYADMMLLSVLNGAMGIERVAMLKRSDLADFDSATNDVAARHLSATRKYVFPLNQSSRTPKQVASDANAKIRKMLEDANVPMFGDVALTLRTYRAYAALKAGASGSMVLKSGGGVIPAGLPILKLCAYGDLSVEASAALDDAVRAMLLTNPLRWFAMRLRPGAHYREIEARIKATGASALIVHEMFYPMEEIARRKRNKIVWVSRPVIADIVFFRSRLTDVQPLFAEIGDLAWCYKSAGVYATISDSEMAMFQYAIGKFTPDTEIYPIGTVQMKKNDRVEILGGMFSGYSATFDSSRSEATDSEADSARVLYRLMMPSGNGIEWVLDIDPRLVKKIN